MGKNATPHDRFALKPSDRLSKSLILMEQRPKRRATPSRPGTTMDRTPDMLTTGALNRDLHLLMAHGAGASMTSPFLETMARLLDERGITVHRFEFPYMAARTQSGVRRPPPRAETLTGSYCDAITACRRQLPPKVRLFIGGKSMGGRVACLAAGERNTADTVSGVVVLGYPFHPPGKPDKSRAPALRALTRSALIVQGTRDPFGGPDKVARLELPSLIRIFWIEDGDHDLAPRKASGVTHAEAQTRAADAISAFMKESRHGAQRHGRSNQTV